MLNKKPMVIFFIGSLLFMVGFLGKPYLSITINEETHEIELRDRVK